MAFRMGCCTVIVLAIGLLICALLLPRLTRSRPHYPGDIQEPERLHRVITEVGHVYLDCAKTGKFLRTSNWRVEVRRHLGEEFIAHRIDGPGVTLEFAHEPAIRGEVFRAVGRRYALVALRSGGCALVVHLPSACDPRGLVLTDRGGFTWAHEQDIRGTVLQVEARRTNGPAISAAPGDRIDIHAKGKPLGVFLSDLEESSGLAFCYEDYVSGDVGVSETPLFNKPVSISLSGVTVWNALDTLAQVTGEFAWGIDGDFVHIVATRCTGVHGYPLEEVLARIRFSGTLESFLSRLGEVAPGVEEGSSTLKWRESPLRTHHLEIDLTEVTVRTVLDRVCEQVDARWASYGGTAADEGRVVSFHPRLTSKRASLHGQVMHSQAGQRPRSEQEEGPAMKVVRHSPRQFSTGAPVGHRPPANSEGSADTGQSAMVRDRLPTAAGPANAPRWLVPMLALATIAVTCGLAIVLLRAKKRGRSVQHSDRNKLQKS